MLTEEQAKQILDDAMPQIKKSLIDNLAQESVYQVSQSLRETSVKAIQKFIDEEISPEITAHLLDNKPAILKGALAAIDGALTNLTTELIKDAQKRMGESYYRRDVIKAIFGQ